MPVTEKTNALISHRTDAAICGRAVMEIAHLNFAERLTAAFVALLACWAVGALCILVPVLHFFLVPLGAIAGVVAFVYKIRLHERRSAIEIECPSCRAKLPLKAASFNWPMLETCYSCRTALRITPL